MKIREALNYLLHGMYKAPFGFLWGCIVLTPALFVIMFDICRHWDKGTIPACLAASIVTAVAMPLIVISTPFVAFGLAREAVTRDSDPFFIQTFGEALR